MTVEQHLRGILAREAVDTGPYSPVRAVQAILDPLIREWAGDRLISVSPSGSFAKGTANASGTDIDLFISLSESTTETLKEVYDKLHRWFSDRGYSPSRQNVSIAVKIGSYDVDLVPGKRQSGYGSDHSLYRRRTDSWTKTNVTEHIAYVWNSGRQEEIRTIKLWRQQKRIDLPSFYLELTVINALSGYYGPGLGDRVWRVFEYLRDSFRSARIMDPSNTNNVVSDDLSSAGRAAVAEAATRALSARDWNEIVA